MILDEIAAKTKERIARCKEQISFEEMKAKALAIVEKETENGTKPYTVFLSVTIWQSRESPLSAK